MTAAPGGPDNRCMHLLIPFAAPLSDAGRQALQALAVPRLDTLLPTLTQTLSDDGPEDTLSPPHERALASAIGLSGADGCIPWAAHAAALAGVADARDDDRPWGRLTPVHLHVGSDQVNMVDPAELALDEAASREAFDAVRELYTSEGFTMAWQSPTCWLASHECLRELPTASLDRVIGRSVDPWLPGETEAPLLRRLHNEVQMLLYTHPLNARREAAGQLAVNSVWLSGCGTRQPAIEPADLRVDERLRDAALAGDWAGWAETWQALDAGPVAELLNRVQHAKPVTLTLCGERSAVQLAARPRGLWQRLAGGLRKPHAVALLETL
jgi:hypothetical protein